MYLAGMKRDFSIKYTSSRVMGGCPDKLTSILYHCDSLSDG